MESFIFLGALNQFFSAVDTILGGPPSQVGDAVVGLLNRSVPLILSFAAKQLLPPVPNLPETLQKIVQSIDLRAWIQKGVETLWAKVQDNPAFARIRDSLIGQPLSDQIPVGDPRYLWATRQGKVNVRIVVDGETLTTWLSSLIKPSMPAATQTRINAFITKVRALETDAVFKQEIDAIIEVSNSRKKKKFNPDPVQAAQAKKAALFATGTQKIRALAADLDKMLHDLVLLCDFILAASCAAG